MSNDKNIQLFYRGYKKHLSFIEKKYNYKYLKIEQDEYLNIKLYLLNKNINVGIVISHEPFEGVPLSIYFVRLVEGQFPPYPIFYNGKEDIKWFNFDDYLLVKNISAPTDKIDDLFNVKEVEYLIMFKEYSQLVKKYGTKLLEGKFSDMVKIKQIIRGRN